MAKRKLSQLVAEKLHALINLLESAECLQDVNALFIYNLHPLEGKRKGQYALDINGRRGGYRLIIIPLNDAGEKWQEGAGEIYQATRIIIIWEVSNHYE